MLSIRFAPLAPLVLTVALSACGGASPETPPAQPPAASEPVSAAASPEAGPAEAPAAPGGEAPVLDPPPYTPIGVPECDKFVDKYVACVEVRVPAEHKDRLMKELHVHRARWRELLRMQDGKLATGLACRGVAQRMKGDLTVDFGCEF